MFAASKTASVAVDGGYQISRSLRFNSADNAYLSRTPSSSSSKTTWTFSTWVKRSALDNFQTILSAGQPSSSVYLVALFFANNNLDLAVYGSGGAQEGRVTSTAVYRDMSAWYHVMAVLDTTNATSSNRLKLYINGSQITAFSTSSYPAQNSIYAVNSTDPHIMGAYSYGTTLNKIDGYQTETYLIDGQALTPSSFGETNAQTGVWQPKAYSGSYGTNGFYLNFSDNSNTTAATLGKDYSGNGNNWTPNNFSVTAGAGNDSLVDSPTSYGTDTGVGGTVRGNYATLNPLANGGGTLTNGNLDLTNSTGSYLSRVSTIGVTSGKWYCEVTVTALTIGSNGLLMGVSTITETTSFLGNETTSYGYYANNGNKYNGGTSTAYGASLATSDVLGIALDLDAGTLTFYKNGTSQGTAFSSLPSATWYFGASCVSSSSVSMNFGQRPFAYTAPSGFKALCTQNLPTPTIGVTTATQAGKYFNPVLYTGNGTGQSITGVGFQPDWVWIKGRSGATDHALYDAVRGVQKQIISDSSAAETTETTGLTAFGSDGFTTGLLLQLNTISATYVAWNWKANGSGSTNTSGSITSTVSANTTSGFSVVTYTGTGANATVGHGLGVAPSFIIVKRRDAGSSWNCYQISLGASQYIQIDGTAGAATNTGVWNNTAPTSSVFSIGTAFAGVNASGSTHVAYCFAEVAGYSKFGSYTGNGSTDGPFIYCGFRPAYVMFKNASVSGAWEVYDTARNTYNSVDNYLLPNVSDAEGVATNRFDYLSNGVKVRNTGGSINGSGNTIIFMAFASNPFKYSLAR